MVYTYALGAYARKSVEVRFLFPAQKTYKNAKNPDVALGSIPQDLVQSIANCYGLVNYYWSSRKNLLTQ